MALGPRTVHLIHRSGAAVIGLALLVFAITGLVRGLSWFRTEGQWVYGLSSNGALAIISVVAGALLVGAALWGPRVSSTTSVVFAVLFLLSGIVHLAILHTTFNVLAFRLPNVFFSLVVGIFLLVLGFYGRVSGGLPPDNPYRRAHPMRSRRPDPEEQLRAEEPDEQERRLLEAEVAMGEGKATAEQVLSVRRDHARRRASERARAWRQAARRGSSDGG
ncbi:MULTISPECIES: DUF4383 domain-containing protein [unclassified Actinopolyspora]|uniref:DUF4383 domain-containing protein n=1 Tax=Actinopolyspora TaxID=1849 RepID=UPI0013F5CF5F|nr:MULTISPECIES: DUF4383 domain-containing protein [unclassified Actinopolyspora]NHD15831.1 DUF4383 domain-containing protein [Actinopolyspora sp. BKK2]NHE74955.1 DUF4383 domain-containing protein [Actinopolyspora sp. BKK1]